MSELTTSDLQSLCNLLNQTQNNSDSEDEIEDQSASGNNITPSSLGPNAKGKPKKVNPYSKINQDEKKRRIVLDPDDENAFEFEEQENTTKSDWKKTPSWDISYRQQVTASDVFLQMGFKSPTTASCEDMIVTIHLPEEKFQNMDLKIVKDKLHLISPRFYLDLNLPHPVDPQRGNAQWDKNEERLTVTLKMDRELDLVNF